MSITNPCYFIPFITLPLPSGLPKRRTFLPVEFSHRAEKSLPLIQFCEFISSGWLVDAAKWIYHRDISEHFCAKHSSSSKRKNTTAKLPLFHSDWKCFGIFLSLSKKYVLLRITRVSSRIWPAENQRRSPESIMVVSRTSLTGQRFQFRINFRTTKSTSWVQWNLINENV